VECATEQDVLATIQFARETDLQMAIRAGGTSPAGFSSVDSGVLVDLSRMRGIAVDPIGQSARVGAGVVVRDLINTLGPTGLVVPVGECKVVGIAGLALGGGFGLLSRSLGLTCDSLLEARVATAGGQILIASESEHPDLFWALRGAGGGSFGVVSQLTFRLHTIVPEITYAHVVWPRTEAAAVLRCLLPFLTEEADGLTALISMFPVPQAEPVLGALAVYNGPKDHGQAVLSRLCAFGQHAKSTIKCTPYHRLVTSIAELRPRTHYQFKSGFVTGHLPNEAVELIVERFAEAPQNTPNSECMVMFEFAGGAVNRIPRSATAFMHRHHTFLLSIVSTWRGPTGWPNSAGPTWAARLYSDLQGYLSDEAYQNYPDLDMSNWPLAYYGDGLERLSQIKTRYDPDNVFRFPQSIKPR
jgi:FAD/FMN-containing dehydrogenase